MSKKIIKKRQKRVLTKKKRDKSIRRRGRPPLSKSKQSKRRRGLIYKSHLIRGMKDILPDDQKYWKFVLDKAESLANGYGFQKIDTPIIEEASLFKRGIGLTTDIVEKEFYNFLDRSGDQIALRPEATASIARAYIEHGMQNLPQPIKFYYYGPMFRYERPQAGRQRQFHQFGLEVIGSNKPIIDAQIIFFTWLFFQNLELKITIQVNSLGCEECRGIYRKKIVDFFRSKIKFLCPNCRKKIKKNPLRILDCKEESCQKVILQAPQIIDWLCEECRNHFVKVLEYLDEVEVIYTLNPRIVRGLDYYTRTVFEIWPVSSASSLTESTGNLAILEKKDNLVNNKGIESISDSQDIQKPGSQSALGGGGRYDHLIEMLGGQSTPACGVAFGIERIIEELKLQNVKLPQTRKPQIFIAQLGEMARQRALKIFEILRKEGFKVAENLSKDSLKTQLEIANRLGVRLSLIIGQEEILHNTVIIRNMINGTQELVDQDKIIREIKKRLK